MSQSQELSSASSQTVVDHLGKQGVLLVNLGTPDAPTPEAVKRYLAEFLHDHRVVDLTRWLWCPILHGIILQTRPKRVAKAYQSIWTEQGSPLLAITQQQAQALAAQLNSCLGIDIPVEVGMTYGNPSIARALDVLMAKGVEEVIVLPLYPQYSATTTGAVFDQLARAVAKRVEFPSLTFIRDYYQSQYYIEALACSVEQHWLEKGRGERLLISFHGIPQRYADNGDPYPEHCKQTAQALAQRLGLRESEWLCSFQSRFGKEEWIKPYTDKVIEQWGQEIAQLDVICPAFAADCLETLEEIQVENKDYFLESGGKVFNYIPALNCQPAHIDMMVKLVMAKLHQRP
ncbi:ferrochelatase [Oceanospirillum multiglobuliferum]|uniref:Ferrochelatase n=1 Tax=Oceanospirillum multiglobuliferum TaxID=64969 RepID=A0A1T4RI78_9GAMM|nr:ferrochelatase [Oceanospirillum multiglobuliferum]OPX54798.1 ferrochelatase [Oceanospirillum multiglobuliferum]SKA15692.1 ferrochelatase [Oceanospirillum multiglobuliferum]